jgi:hypothetical protein
MVRQPMRDDDQRASCFDPTRAEFPTRVLPLECVVDLLSVSHAPERIAQYRVEMQRGDRFPPIAVVRIGRRFLVADGHKRLSAWRELTRDPIVVQVWTLRRLLRDQWQQLTRKTRQHLRLARQSCSDPRARQDTRRLALDTVGHWRRVVRSLRARR